MLVSGGTWKKPSAMCSEEIRICSFSRSKTSERMLPSAVAIKFKPAFHSRILRLRFLLLVCLAANVDCRCNLLFLLREHFLAALD